MKRHATGLERACPSCGEVFKIIMVLDWWKCLVCGTEFPLSPEDRELYEIALSRERGCTGEGWSEMRHISFQYTQSQMLESYELVRRGKKPRKTVTRRVSDYWMCLQRGDLVQPVEKVMGLKKGEKYKLLGPPIRVVSVRRERLRLVDSAEVAKEGFPRMRARDFRALFFGINNLAPSYNPMITRIEFEYPPFGGEEV